MHTSPGNHSASDPVSKSPSSSPCSSFDYEVHPHQATPDHEAFRAEQATEEGELLPHTMSSFGEPLPPNPEKDHYPLCIVWAPIPVLTYVSLCCSPPLLLLLLLLLLCWPACSLWFFCTPHRPAPCSYHPSGE
jgi:hypothetical protein